MARTSLRSHWTRLAATSAVGLALACGAREPRTDAERLARGREIVERMSTKLGSTPAFTVTTIEVRDELKASGQPHRVSVTRATTVRRPNRLYSTVSGDRRTEAWYDGVGLTLVLHNDKIFAQGRTPETLDKALDAIHGRYGVSTPVADYPCSTVRVGGVAYSQCGATYYQRVSNGYRVVVL
jgi:hypothetical protein